MIYVEKNSPDKMEKSLNPENGDAAKVGERSGMQSLQSRPKQIQTNADEPETVLSGPAWEIYRE